jgi:hypothetical protein
VYIFLSVFIADFGLYLFALFIFASPLTSRHLDGWLRETGDWLTEMNGSGRWVAQRDGWLTQGDEWLREMSGTGRWVSQGDECLREMGGWLREMVGSGR